LDGDGTDSILVVRDGIWFEDRNNDGTDVNTIFFGTVGDNFLIGDFDDS